MTLYATYTRVISWLSCCQVHYTRPERGGGGGGGVAAGDPPASIALIGILDGVCRRMLPYANHHQPPFGAATTDRLAAATAAGALVDGSGGAAGTAAAMGSVSARGGQSLTVDPPQMSSAVAHALAAVLTDGLPLSESAIVLATRAACALESQALAAPPVRSLGRRQQLPSGLAAPAAAPVARATPAGPARQQSAGGQEVGLGGQVVSSSSSSGTITSSSSILKGSEDSGNIRGSSTLARPGHPRSLHQGECGEAAGHEHEHELVGSPAGATSSSSSSPPLLSDARQKVRPSVNSAAAGPRTGTDAERILGVPPLLPRVNAAAVHRGTVASAAAASPHEATSANPSTGNAAFEDLASTPTAMESLMASLMDAKMGSRQQQQHQQRVGEEERHELVQHVPGPSEQLQMLRAAAHPQLGDQRLLLRMLSLALTQHWAGRAGHRQQRQQHQHELQSQSERYLLGRRSRERSKGGPAPQHDPQLAGQQNQAPHHPGAGERLSWLLRVAQAVLANPRTADEAESAAVRRFRRELQAPGEAAGSADPRVTLMRVRVMLDELPGAERLAEAEDEWSSSSDADGDSEEGGGGGGLTGPAAAEGHAHMHPHRSEATAGGGGGGSLREALRDRLKALVAAPSPEVLSLLAVTPAAVGGRATHGGAAMLRDLFGRFPPPPTAVRLGRPLASQPPVVAQRGAVRQAAHVGEEPPVVARAGAVRQAVEELLDEIEVELLSETLSGALALPATTALGVPANAASLAVAGAAAGGQSGRGMGIAPAAGDADLKAADRRRELLMDAVGVAANLPQGEAMAKRRRSMAGALDQVAAKMAGAGLLQPEDQLQLLQLLADGNVVGAPLAKQLVAGVSGWLLQGQGERDAADELEGGQGHVAAMARRVEVSERLLALLPKLGMAREPVVVQLEQLYGRQAAANQLQRIVAEVALRAARRGPVVSGCAVSGVAAAATGTFRGMHASGSWYGGEADVGPSATDGTGAGAQQPAAPAAGAKDLLAGLRGRLLSCLVAADVQTRVKTLCVLAELGAVDREVMETAADRLLSNLSVSLLGFRHWMGALLLLMSSCLHWKGSRSTRRSCWQLCGNTPGAALFYEPPLYHNVSYRGSRCARNLYVCPGTPWHLRHPHSTYGTPPHPCPTRPASHLPSPTRCFSTPRRASALQTPPTSSPPSPQQLPPAPPPAPHTTPRITPAAQTPPEAPTPPSCSVPSRPASRLAQGTSPRPWWPSASWPCGSWCGVHTLWTVRPWQQHRGSWSGSWSVRPLPRVVWTRCGVY